MSDYNKVLKEKEELAKLKVELADKGLGKYLDKQRNIEENKNNEKEIQKEVKSFVEEKMENRKMKLRRFKIFVLGISLTAVGIGVYRCNKTTYTPEVEAAITLENEIGIHGGYKNIDDKYVYDLSKHLESGDCAIPKEDELSMEERIEKYCNENNLSDEVAQLAKEKYKLCYNNKFSEYNKLEKLSDVVKREQKENKKNFSSIDSLSQLKNKIEELRDNQIDNGNSLGM